MAATPAIGLAHVTVIPTNFVPGPGRTRRPDEPTGEDDADQS